MGHPLITARDDFAGVKCTNPCAKCKLQKILDDDLMALVYSLDVNGIYCVLSDGSKTEDAAGNWSLIGGCPPSHAAIWLQSYVSLPTDFLLPPARSAKSSRFSLFLGFCFFPVHWSFRPSSTTMKLD